MSIRTAALLTTFVLPPQLYGQNVAERISRVEQGLLTPVVVRGAATGMSLTERMAHHRVPGVSIAVVNDGRIEWARGYGVVETGGSTPVDTSTLFQAASISKPIAALGALRLVEQGKLSLDADVNAQLRTWRVPENDFTRRQQVTLRRLLSHNAGMTVHGFRGYAQGESVPGVVQVLNGQRPANSAAVRVDTLPGALWRYSGGGTTVVQLLMQDVTGHSFPELMRELVLAPLQLDHSSYEQPLPAARARHAATGHRPAAIVAGKWHTYPEMFAAGLWTTPSDLARVAIEMQRSLRGESNRVLSRAMAQQMLTVQAGDYGLGFGVESGDGWKVFSHGGANEGFRAMFYAFADRGQGVFIMTNSDTGAPLAAELMRAVAREYNWPTQQPVERAVVPIDAVTLRAFAGSYTFSANGLTQTVVITVDGSTLRTEGRPIGTRTLYHGGESRFFPLDLLADVRFERDATGAITHAVFAGPGAPIRMQRNRP